jgi:hypothetical protein
MGSTKNIYKEGPQGLNGLGPSFYSKPLGKTTVLQNFSAVNVLAFTIALQRDGQI